MTLNDVHRVSLLPNYTPRGYAFVSFGTEDDAEVALRLPPPPLQDSGGEGDVGYNVTWAELRPANERRARASYETDNRLMFKDQTGEGVAV